MSRLRVESFAISLDGYGAGPNQSLEASSMRSSARDLPALGYECGEHVATKRATHVVLRRTA